MREKKTVDERMVREIPDWRHDPKLTPPAPALEYKTMVDSRDADLNFLGADGWELVSAIPQPGDRAVYYFKRRK